MRPMMLASWSGVRISLYATGQITCARCATIGKPSGPIGVIVSVLAEVATVCMLFPFGDEFFDLFHVIFHCLETFLALHQVGQMRRQRRRNAGSIFHCLGEFSRVRRG